jgi:hypothetical protein
LFFAAKSGEESRRVAESTHCCIHRIRKSRPALPSRAVAEYKFYGNRPSLFLQKKPKIPSIFRHRKLQRDRKIDTIRPSFRITYCRGGWPENQNALDTAAAGKPRPGDQLVSSDSRRLAPLAVPSSRGGRFAIFCPLWMNLAESFEVPS